MNDILKVPATLIPLSHLELDLPRPSVGGWQHYLAELGIEIVEDELLRPCITYANAARLARERRESEQRARELEAERDRWHEAHRVRPNGIPASEVPDGVLPAQARLQAARDAQPRSTPSQAEWLFQGPDEVTGGSFGPETQGEWDQ